SFRRAGAAHHGQKRKASASSPPHAGHARILPSVCPETAHCNPYDRNVREPPHRLERLPSQYFAALLKRVAAAGADVVDLGRGNPEVGPPAHVVEALTSAAARPEVHGYAPFRGLRELKEAVAERYRSVYGVELDPGREV